MKTAKIKPSSVMADAPTRHPWGMFLLSMLAGWLVYANSLHNEFVFDDAFTVVNQKAIQHFEFASIFRTWYRPMRDLSLIIDYRLWGLNPFGFHLTNVLIHSLNSCLVLALALKIVKETKMALLVALIFAVHPVQTEAVAYISGRRDVLFALFYFASFYSFIRFREGDHWGWAIGSLIAFGLSLTTKEMAATLPVVLLLWEFSTRWEPQPGTSLVRHILRRFGDVIHHNRGWLLASSILLIGFIVVSFMRGRGVGSSRTWQLAYWGGSAWSNFLTVLTVHAYYLKLLVWPIELIASYQGAFPIAHSIGEGRVILSAVILLGLLLVMVYSLNRDNVVSFALAFHFIALLPVSHIIPHHELLAEHYLYLPMFGFALLLGRLLQRVSRLSREWTWSVTVSAVMILIALGARTMVRNRDWANSYTLWQATYQSLPQSPRAAYNMGVEHLNRQEIPEAIACLEQAIALQPSHVLAYNNLAVAHLAQGEPQRALGRLEAAMQLDVTEGDRALWGKRDATHRLLRRNAARCYLELGQPEHALPFLESAIEINEGDAASFVLLAQTYERLNRRADAVAACRQGLAREPGSEDLQRMLARLHAHEPDAGSTGR